MPAKIKQNTSQHQLKKPKNDSLVQNSWQDTEDQAKAEKKFLELLQNRDKNNSEISAEPENANDNSAKEIQKHLNSYLLAVKNTGCSAATIRNYKSDIKQFLDFLGENNLEALGSKPKLLAFAKYQREKGLKDSSIKRKIVSIGQFKNWLKDEGLLKSEIPLSTKQVKNAPSQDLQAIDSRIALEQELKAQQLVAQQLLAQQTQTHGGEDSTKLAQETKKRRSWFGQSKRGVGQAQHRPNKLALILNIIALLFFIGGLGYLAYQQFGQAVLSLAYPSLPTSPNRILSFQGRLTNTARTPIATQTDMVYKLYDNVTGGNLLWSSNTCTITPDQDGIFNTNLGAGAGDGSDDEDCGATIDDSVFTENSNVWLEVTVGNAPSSETLTPRQPIRTVAYAINAETVQGIRPSLIATHSTLLMLNDQGQLVLGTDSPEVKTATGSSLMVEADSIMIQTQAGSNGDIILAPDGIGNVGIGTTDPSEKLDVDGKIRIRTIDNAVGDILTTSATGIIQKRTAEELRGDIGAGREINSVYYVEGNTSGTAGTWTGNHDDVITYYDGLKVAYKIGIAGASTTRLNINNLGAVLVRRNNANLTTHLPVGTVVVLTYTTIAGTPYWVWADYDSDTTESYTVRWNNTLQAGAQITKYKIIMAGTDNKWYPLTVGDTTAATKTVASTEFLINSPILAYYTTPTIAPNATFTNIWEGINMAYLDYTLNQSSGMTAYAPVYLVGTINANGNFVLDGAGTANNNFWTQTLPTTEDGKVYIMIGIMHNTTTTMRLMVNKPMYEFKDGKIREYSDPDLSEYVPYSGATQDLDLGSNNLYVGGDVGIGTTAPSYKLDVAGDINLTGALRANGSAGTIGQILLSQGANNPVWSDVSGAISDYAWLQGGNSFGSIGVLGTNDAYDLQLETGGATQMTIDTTGNVGIGTTDPAGKLHLNLGVGNINSSVYIDQTSSTGYSSITMRDERVSNSYVGQWGLYGSGVSAPNTSNMFFYNTAGGGIGFYVGSGSPTNDLRMFIANSGKVGIGTTAPSYKLDVAGDINTTGTYRMAGVDYGQYFIDSAGSSSQVWKSDGSGRGYWATDETGTALPTGTLTGQTIYWNGTSWTYSNNLFNNNTNVGVGTTNPLSLFSVGNSSQFRVDSSGNLVRINNIAYSWPSSQGTSNTALVNDGSGNLAWTATSSLGTNYWDLENQGLSPTNTSLNLYVGGDATASAKFMADGNTGNGYFAGDVGIGTPTPSAKLDVAGNILVQANGSLDTKAVGSLTIGGTTQTGLTLGRSGATTSLTGSNVTLGGIGYGGTSNTLTFTSAGTTGQALLSGGTGAPSFGTVGLTYGGTNANLSGSAPGGVIYRGASSLASTGAGTTGQVLISQGSGAPIWSNVSGVIDDYAFIQGGNSFASTAILGTNDAYNLQFETGGTSQMTIDTTGKVGIGNTSPSTLLQLGAVGKAGTLGIAGSTSGLVTLQTAAAAGTWTMTLPTSAGTSGQVLTTNGSGVTSWANAGAATNVALSGITAALSANSINNGDLAQVWNWQLTTADKVGFTFGENVASTATGAPAILAASTLASSTAMPLYVKNLGAANSFRVDDEVSDTTPFVIDASGNVGIGTGTPSYKLDITGSVHATTSYYSPSGSVIKGTTYDMTYLGISQSSAHLSNFTYFGGSTSNNIAAINTGGGVGTGLGAAVPQYSIANDRDTGFYGLSGNEAGISTGGISRIHVFSNGNVGIGTTSPSTLLQLGTAGTTAGTLSLAGATSGLVTVNTAAAAGTWTMTLPTSAGTSGQVLTTNGSGVTSWTSPSSSVKWNDITDPDGNQSLAMGGNTSSWSFDSLSTTNFGLNMSTTATGLTTGGLLSLAATGTPAASWTGDLAKIEYNNTSANVDGSALKLGLLGSSAAGSGTVLNITTSQTGTGALALRVNDDGTYADTTPFVIDASGNVGIGTGSPSEKITLNGGNFLHTASGNPTLEGTYDTSGNSNRVYVSGKYAYVADYGSGLQIIDISNPSSPTLAGTYNTSGNAIGINVSGKYAYVADGSAGLRIIDISNPSSPTLTGTYDTSGSAYDVYVSGKYAYVGDWTSGLQIIDISNPSSPTLAGTYNTSGNAIVVYVSGKYAYVADYGSGLQIIDISNPSSPTLTGTYDTAGVAFGVYVSGKYAYVADYSSGLQILDISNPSSPTLAGTYDTSGNAINVYVSGKYAYVTGYSSGLQIIDISNPSSPSQIGMYSGISSAWGIYVSGKYAYVGDYNTGLYIFDINGIETPSLYAGNIQTNAMTVTENLDIGNNLYVRNGVNVGPGGLYVDEGEVAFDSNSSSTAFSFRQKGTGDILNVFDNTTEVFTILDGGNVGIGTTTPSTLLQLGTAGTTAGTLSLAGATSGLVTINTAAAAGTWSMTLPTSAGTSGQVLTTNGSGVTSWASAGAASNVALSGITAALSANSINNGDNAQVWNWQLTTADKVGFTFGENVASTATGSPAILSASTLASSTAMPLYVKNLGAANSFRVDDEVSDTTPFVIDASGNVGIGTASPLYKLDVNGDLRAEKFFDYTNVNYYLDPAAAGTSMTVAGSVGIGTTSPSSFKLQVAGNVGPNANDTYSLGSTALRWSDLYLGPSTLHLGTSATDEGLISYNTTSNILNIDTDSTSNGDIAFLNNQLYLDKSSGSVGIGTTNPYNKLHIMESAVTGSDANADDILVIEKSGDSNINIIGSETSTVGFLFSDSMRGVGQVKYNLNTNNMFFISSGGGYAFGEDYWSASPGTNNLVIQGNVGIGTTSPTEKLTLNGGNFLHTASGNPTLKGTYDTNGEAYGVYVSGKYAYVADRAWGLQIIDVSNPASPSLTGTYDTSGDARGVHVSGKYAYVADWNSGLQIIDISNPVSPSLTGTYSTGGYARDVYVSGKYAYVGDVNASLKIIDISNPASPTLTSTYGSGYAQDVYVSGRYLYLALGAGGIRIVDISNPASPSQTGTLATQNASGVSVSGKYAYVADGSSGLLIIDVSNPASPSLIGTLDTSGIAFGIYVSGKYAYVVDRSAGLQIIDINGIETPSLYAGNIQTNAMTITENLDLGNNLYVRNGLNVGMGGIQSDGIISSNGAYFLGNVGIGTTNPTYQLQLSTNSAAKPTSNTWTISSDSRLKTNIQNFSDGLDVIKAINPVSYVLNGKAGMPEGAEGIGVIAQEIKDIAPYTVGTFYAKLNPEDQFETELYNFDSSALTFVLINAVKEQQLQIEDLLKTDLNLIASQSTLNTKFNNFKNSLITSFSTALINTQKLIAEQIEVGGQNLDQYIKSVVQLALNNNELDLPQSESDSTPASPTMLAELIIENDLGETVASIDNGGNAQLAGDLEVTGDLIAGGNTRLGQLLAEEASVSTLLAENISTENIAAQLAQVNQAEIEQANIDNAQINSASVSGELYAQTINTDNLHASSIDADIINGLQERLEAAVAQQLADSTLLASLTNDSTTTEEYLEQVATDMGTDLNSSSSDGTLDNTDTDTLNSTIMAYSAYIDSYFEVNGSALIKEGLAVGQTLMVGNGLTMGDGYIAYQSETSNDLAIQPAGRGRLSLMANLMTLDESGLVTVNGDLKVAGAMEVEEDLKVKDTLLTNLISAENPNEGIHVQLAQAITNEEGNEEIKQSNFEFIDESGTPIATMSASGDLSLTGGLKVEQQPAGASESANLNNKSAGQAVIPAGATSVSIKTARLGENSMIYITPLGSTNNQVIYVQNKLLDSEFTEENEAQFTVGVDFALDQDVYFNWWLVN